VELPFHDQQGDKEYQSKEQHSTRHNPSYLGKQSGLKSLTKQHKTVTISNAKCGGPPRSPTF